MMGPMALGKMWYSTILRPDAPMLRAATTNSISRMMRQDARTRRATVIHESKPITSAIVSTLFLWTRGNSTSCRIALNRIRTRSAGRDSAASVMRIRTLSTHPPK